MAQTYYSDNPGNDMQPTYNTLAQYGKPFLFAEFGSGGPSAGDTSFQEPKLISDIQTYLPNTVMWTQWWDGNGSNAGWGMAETQNVGSALANSWVINRGGITYTTGGAGGQPMIVILGANDNLPFLPSQFALVR